ncbi:MAG: hypothetical protein B7Z10_07205 [Rhodobacterales bacterium 32-66-7]|nr:MAG: hypothetical protein B7Z10_07205 [Rhodobacterales bacterium 32-66-7]
MTGRGEKPALQPLDPKTNPPGPNVETPLAFQILIDSTPASEDRFSPALRLNFQSIRLAYSGYRHHLFEQDEIRSILADCFDREVLAAYDALLPYAFRADLARYCLLYQFGGLYSDLSYLHVQPIILQQEKDLILFRDLPGLNPPYALSNSVILARPEHPLMEAAIRQIVAHHLAGFVGTSSLQVTGPHMLGKLQQARPEDRSVLIGTSRRINRDRRGRRNIVKLLPGGELVALRNKGANASIGELLRDAGNSYHHMWREGKVWAESDRPHRFATKAVPPLQFERSLRDKVVAWARQQLR